MTDFDDEIEYKKQERLAKKLFPRGKYKTDAYREVEHRALLILSLIPKAKLRVITGMGHDFPESLVPRLSRLLIKHVNRSDTEWQQKLKKKKRAEVPTKTAANEDSSDPMDWLEPLDSPDQSG